MTGARRPSAQWKEAERRIARLLGGERVSNHALGTRTPDVLTAALAVEVKHRKRLPALVTDALAQARRNAPAGKLAVAVLHAQGQRYEDAVLVVRLGDVLDAEEGNRGQGNSE